VNRLMHLKATNVLLAIAVALLAANLAASTSRATASIENVRIAQIDKQATPQPENEAGEPDAPVGNSFTYQGRLKDGPNPANGQYDFTFKLFDSISGGTQVGPTLNLNNRTVSEGLVTTNLDFGVGRFQGQERYLEVAVRPTGGGGFTTLVPRQLIAPAPNSLFSLDTQSYDNVVVVAKSGGDYTNISTALIIITDASPTNRYLVKVGPGIYTDTITMKQYVDIEGSGEGTTRITSGGGATPLNGSTVQGADNAGLRNLTVENTGGDDYAAAIHNNDDSPSLQHVTLNVSGGTADNYGVYNNNSSPSLKEVTVAVSGAFGTKRYGVFNADNSSPSMDGVTITVAGLPSSGWAYGVYNSGSSPSMTGVTATASGSSSYGVYNSNSSPTMTNMTANGGSSGVHNSGSSPRMTGVTATASGNFISHAIENHDNSSPLMKGVTAIVSGTSGGGTGVDNRDSSPTMTDMTISVSASGDSSATGVYNSDSTVTMTNLVLTVTREEGTSTGVSNLRSTVKIVGSHITLVEGALPNDSGIVNASSSITIQSSVISLQFTDLNDRAIRNIAVGGSYTVRIDNSTLQAAVIIGNDAEFDNYIGASKMDFFVDAITGSGTVTCAGVYDEDYNFFANTCP
jgi:hypothetical protein